MDMDRRGLLISSGMLAIAGVLGRADRLLASPRFSEDPFSLGVASGDPMPDGFVLWTRLAPHPFEPHGGMPMAAVLVRWEVALDERFARIVQAGEALARPELAHSVHVEVSGLAPRRPYWYRFTVDGGAQSPIGMVRTAPAASDLPGEMRLVVAGCQNYAHGWYDAWRHISREPDLDAIFHYGDYIYEQGAPSKIVIRDAAGAVVDRSHTGGETYSLDDYRRRYALYKRDPDLKAAHAAAAFIVSFDDHEVDNNWTSAFDQDGTPPETFLLRRFAAMQAWYEHMPVRQSQFPRLGGLTMYRRLDYGSLCRIHVLDTRSYRSDQLCMDQADHHCRTGPVPGATVLGAEQEAWLGEGLRSGPQRWNLLAQQVRMMPLVRRGPTGEVLPTPTDTWSGYPAARAALAQMIQTTAPGTVMVATGDAHMHNVGTVPVRDEEPDGPAAAVEFLVSSISSEGDGAPVTPVIQGYLDGHNPNLALANHQRGYDLFNVTPGLCEVAVKVLDKVQVPGGTLSTLASFAVEQGKVAICRS